MKCMQRLKEGLRGETLEQRLERGEVKPGGFLGKSILGRKNSRS